MRIALTIKLHPTLVKAYFCKLRLCSGVETRTLLYRTVLKKSKEMG